MELLWVSTIFYLVVLVVVGQVLQTLMGLVEMLILVVSYPTCQVVLQVEQIMVLLVIMV
jgi:hypothetical protein